MSTEIFTLTDGRNALKLVQEYSGHYQFQFKRGDDPYETVWLSRKELTSITTSILTNLQLTYTFPDTPRI